MGMANHSQSSQNSKFAMSLQYHKEDVRDEADFLDPDQARIQDLKEVSQVDEIAVFPFVSNSDVFDLSHVSLSELRCQRPRYASHFMLLLIDQ